MAAGVGVWGLLYRKDSYVVCFDRTRGRFVRWWRLWGWTEEI